MALPHCSPGSLYSQSAGTPPPPPLLAGSGFCCVPLPSRGHTLKLSPGCSLSLDSLPHTSAFLISAHRWHSFSHPSSPLHRCLLCPPAACWSQLIPACRKFPDLFQWCPAGSQHLHRWAFPSHCPYWNVSVMKAEVCDLCFQQLYLQCLEQCSASQYFNC